MTSQLGPCPRCGSSRTEKLADSNPKALWEVYGCNDCNYVWRSTEDLSKIPKLTEEKKRNAIWFGKGKPGDPGASM